jgi:hypothetical protein
MPSSQTFHVLKWGSQRSLEEYACLCKRADVPVVVLGPGGIKDGELGRWEAEGIIVRVVRTATWSDVLACRRVLGSANREKPDYPVYVVEALD